MDVTGIPGPAPGAITPTRLEHGAKTRTVDGETNKRKMTLLSLLDALTELQKDEEMTLTGEYAAELPITSADCNYFPSRRAIGRNVALQNGKGIRGTCVRNEFGACALLKVSTYSHGRS